jgi:uncharacterized protein YfaS (alpha-2-macroglobulin family)
LAKFVPNVLTADALKRLGIPTDRFTLEFPRMVQAGLDRLYALQREDGGWGWFDKDKEDSFMTACAVGGLSEAKRLGYGVDAVRLEQGIRRALWLAEQETDPNRLAYLFLSLSRGPATPHFDRLVASPEKLSPYALAACAIGLHRWGRAEAADFRRRLVAAMAEGHWVTRDWSFKWENMAVETTALAVTALSEADPSNPAIAPAIEWLLAQRTGNRWRSTKDTATAIHAILSHVVATGGKLDSLARAVGGIDRSSGAPIVNRQVRITLNGEVRELLVDLNNPASNRYECHFVGGALKPGRNPISCSSQDDFDIEIEGVLRTIGKAPRPSDHFTIATATDKPLDRLRLGEEVNVTLTVAGDDEYDFVMVEAPIPAGGEIIQGSGEGAFSRFEARHEQAIFYLRSVGKTPQVLRFRMRSGFAGRFTVLAPAASVMYDEDLSGLGVRSRAEIGP